MQSRHNPYFSDFSGKNTMNSDRIDRWTPVALSADLPAKTVMPARIGAETIAVWRSAAGDAVASADRCPHRGMRLSHGFVRGETLSCIYHGWRYARSGNCLHIPAHPGLAPPETIRVEIYPIAEQNGLVWVAKSAPAGQPPRFDGLSPLRSIVITAGMAAIEVAAGAKANADGILTPSNAPYGLCLLLSDLSDDETCVHGLIAQDATPIQRIAASRHIETLRRLAEEGAAR